MVGYALMHALIYSQYIPTNHEYIWEIITSMWLTQIGHCVVTHLDLSYLGHMISVNICLQFQITTLVQGNVTRLHMSYNHVLYLARSITILCYPIDVLYK